MLFVCNDVIGKRMAGPAIRSVEMARATAPFFDVLVIAPKVEESIEAPFSILDDSHQDIERIAAQCDVIVIQGDALVRYPFLRNVAVPLIADMYCPMPLEYHQSSDEVPPDLREVAAAHVVRVAREQLAYADHFLCANERQRDFWLGALAVAGRINGLRWPRAQRANIADLISIVPFGLPDSGPEQGNLALRHRFGIPGDDFVALWGGGIYQWFDPLTVIRAVGKLVDEGDRVHLVFMGIRHPNPRVPQHDVCDEAIELARSLGLENRFVHFNTDWVEYDRRHEYFLDADVGVSAHFDTPETRFAFRTRILDYLWCGLPIVATKGDFFGELVRSEQLGVTVDYGDVNGWIAAFRRLRDDRDFRRQCAMNVAEQAKHYRWGSATKPLLALAGRLQPAPDREQARRELSDGHERPTMLHRIRHAYAMGGPKMVGELVIRRLARQLGR